MPQNTNNASQEKLVLVVLKDGFVRKVKESEVASLLRQTDEQD
jgi:hypothetical protein